MGIAFLVTSPYQVFHYRRIAEHLDDFAVVGERRDQDFGLSERFISEHLPNTELLWKHQDDLSDLDGRFDIVVCQTPILPLKFLSKTMVVAQQYSLAKERYQFGVWRSHADLNLMYGPESAALVSGFSHAVSCGNPLFDEYLADGRPPLSRVTDKPRPRLLYMPTYGDLSSLRATLPRLAAMDADITLKLHHAAAVDDASGMPPHISVVFSDADPAVLLREHDGVISDLSGAAFDALYAGLPVVLTGSADLLTEDYDRLSAREQDGSRLAELAGTWGDGDDLMESFARAEKALETDAYQRFLDATFANPGTAGAACAREIQRLAADGPPALFHVEQVRETTRRYIDRNRKLATASSAKAARPESGGGGAVRSARAVVQRVKDGTRGVRRRVGLVRKPHKRAFTSLTQSLSAAPLSAATPTQQRESLFEVLRPHAEAAGLRLVRDGSAVGAAVAMSKADKRLLLRALRAAGRDHPAVRVRMGSGNHLAPGVGVEELTSPVLAQVQWLELELDDGEFPLNHGRRLPLHFVEYDEMRNRYFTLKKVVNRPDWSEWFGPTAPPGPVIAADDPPEHAAGPIDVVYTWVNSSDPQWANKYRSFDTSGETLLNSANNAERFANRDELRYSMRSLWTFAPFVRNIYLVTDDQRPQWLDVDSRVTVVPHTAIFPDIRALPTFNSHAIEANLHRIPGLSENFLYFNDDVFLGSEVTVDDFFTPEGLIKVRLSPSQFIYRGKPESTAIPTDWAAYNSTQLVEDAFNRRIDHRVKHVPLPMSRGLVGELEKRYPDQFAATRAARFRSTTDVAVPSMFAPYYAIASGRAVEWPNVKGEYVYLDTGREDSYTRFKQIVDWQPKFFCLNSTRHTVLGMGTQERNLHQFLERVYPSAAPWEL
ncbi:MAG TPA: stealth conserved region 3 domain-containing protein [Stackebrandtia sp.]|uniref:stealth conserved region 3 domain-containing protein n=1 Tax=Stackebrandtia sp. TaxID=2023065 RepID=UPI002D5CEE18|nr:stealth conserved region 3 domain-containing protein [Stackebrandtia sp.]HZE38223.1 stealth conserved region 3 domain-containing protein [Stackebrandtia sp.]